MGWVQGPGTRAEVGVTVSLVSLGTNRRVDGQWGASVSGGSCGAPELLS